MSILVSVPVLTYNSAEFVEETLESIYNQTYQNLQLIISDDCSKDNTVEIVQKWCNQSRVKERFADIKIITVPKNTGIPANFNRCIKASDGDWLKLISGDDALLPNCILDNVKHVLENPSIKVLYSYLKIYRNTFEEKNFVKLSPAKLPTHIITTEISAFEQYQLFLVSDRIQFTPSMFLNKEAILKAGLPKEHLFSEDFQTKLNLTKAGFKLHFFEKETVLYRQHEMATNNMIQDYVLKPHYFKTEDFRKEYIYPNVPIDVKRWHQFNWIANQIFRIERLNRKTTFSSFLHYILTSVLNPFKYIIYIKATYITKYKDIVFYKKSK
ncbi:MAG: glycosyltransferase family 2 protein [Flavobacterium sp.]|uniref:glycosyltransferase family 2 protein n=1 Tax=Flavobacterium sp. TaxID=239 RepID=UPI0035293A04